MDIPTTRRFATISLAACLALVALSLGCRSFGWGGSPAPVHPETPTTAVAPDAPEAPFEPVVPEAFSLLGEPLVPAPLPPEVRADRLGKLAEAEAQLDESPEDADALIWLGRRLGYMGRYREAVAVFTRGAALYPKDARFLRHRGHRFLTLRRLDLAERDLARAAELVRGQPDRVEPDGLPNALGTPTSTLQSNIWYHLGLARYVQGDFEGALEAYRECLAVSTNTDMLVATSHWLWMTLDRLGRTDEAARVLRPIHAGLEVIENRDYQRLLLLYRGDLSADQVMADAGPPGSIGFATIGYGVANWLRSNGREAEATALFERIVAGGQWASFGHLAAEAELARKGR